MSEPAALDMPAAMSAESHVTDVVHQARTSFYWAMRLLPKPKRQAMFAVYAFCRVVDDIADGDLPTGTKLSQLQGWRDEIGRLYAGNPRHPVARALQAPVAAYDLAREDFLAIIDGMEMDARGPIVAPPLKEFRLYCARVAGAVGLLCVRIFGAPRQDGIALAEALGEAVQTTNILRDIAEDAELGRLYLPQEILQKHGIAGTAPKAVLRHPQLAAVCRELEAMAAARFAEAQAILARLPRGDMKPARLILVVYQKLLQQLRAGGYRHPEQRVSLSKAAKLWLILRHGIF
ncbi:MAG TPA: presqualene diphosphate synthase HpnD [Dongiaceae bacterium]|jgi:phytoene synthase